MQTYAASICWTILLPLLWELYSRLSAEETGARALWTPVSRVLDAFPGSMGWFIGVIAGFVRK